MILLLILLVILAVILARLATAGITVAAMAVVLVGWLVLRSIRRR